jgi:hypothetical protein
MDPAAIRQSILETAGLGDLAAELDHALAADAALHPQGAATYWPRLELERSATTSPFTVLRVGPAGPETAALSRSHPGRIDALGALDPPLCPLWPSIQAQLEGRGTNPEAVQRAIPEPLEAWADVVLRETPFQCVSLLVERGGAVVLRVRPSPVRKGRGGGAIWTRLADGTFGFAPLVLEFEVARGPRSPAVHFSLWPKDDSRRPFGRTGPFDLYHGPDHGVAHQQLMRVSQVVSRAIVAARYDLALIPSAIATEEAATKSVYVASEFRWVAEPQATRHF